MKKHISLLAIVLMVVFSVQSAPARGEDAVIPDSGPAETGKPVFDIAGQSLKEPATLELPGQESAPLPETDQGESSLAPQDLSAEFLDNASSSSSSPDTGTIPTRFSEDMSAPGGSAGPSVKAVWLMMGPAGKFSGTDDGSEPGAQFLPSGRFEVGKPVSICAVISDSDGIADIASAAGSIFYPQAGFGESEQSGRNGCGLPKEQNMPMSALTKDDAVALFCGAIRNQNSNLPVFAGGSGYGDICGGEGELAQEKAGVFCADAELAYDDLSGEYKISVSAKDKGGAGSEAVNATLSYLELTAFETDFAGLDYGRVRQGSVNSVDGDLAWQGSRGENNSTIRNVGNTRMRIEISQNDMGLGKTGGDWNIRYGTRLGMDKPWQNYSPEEKVVLEPVFNLSEAKPADFAIKVLHFPEDSTQNYLGKMTLNALKAEFLSCSVPK